MLDPEYMRPTELRTYLLRYAKKREIMVKEHVSDTPGQKLAYFCHLQPKNSLRTATAVSAECPDTALAKAFLYLYNPELTFLPEKS